MRCAAAALSVAAMVSAAGGAAACRMAPSLQEQAVPGSLVEVAGPEDALTAAWYADLTGIYDHGILGDALEPTTLHASSAATSAQCGLSVEAGEGHVFEDVAPRLADVDGDGRAEVIAVRSSLARGAQLVVYAPARDGLSLEAIAETPYIGQPHRWLAPVGVADLDGDGAVEVAYVDRPHLAKVLRVWRWDGDGLVEVAAAEGVTNHRIGETDIAGGVRDCGAGPEVVGASGDWARLLAVRFDGARLTAREIGRDTSRAGFGAALGCR